MGKPVDTKDDVILIPDHRRISGNLRTPEIIRLSDLVLETKFKSPIDDKSIMVFSRINRKSEF